MTVEEVKLISEIASVWGWHIVAFMFFLQALDFLINNRILWAIPLFAIFGVCEAMALKRKWRVETK